jgi:hypothetical protein
MFGEKLIKSKDNIGNDKDNKMIYMVAFIKFFKYFSYRYYNQLTTHVQIMFILRYVMF